MMLKKITIGFISAAALTAFAFTWPTAKTETTYMLDINATSATWVGKKVTGQHTGGITISKGTFTTDEGNIKSGSFEFDMNSITCTDLTDKESNEKLVGHLKSEDFFGTHKHPVAKFEITEVTLKEAVYYTVTGKLTIKGITNEITFPAVIKKTETASKIYTTATILVNRTKFDIKYGSASFFDTLGDKAINDEFELNINVVASAK